MSTAGKYAAAAGAGLILAAALLAAYGIGLKRGRNGANSPVKVVTEQIIVRDTIREKYPVYVDRWKTRTELVEVRDTVHRADTVFMAVDIERRTYEGDDYRAVVEGWRPTLAEIAVFPKTVYLQTEVQQLPDTRRRTRLGVGFTAGPAVIWTPDGIKAGAGVAGGLTITF